MTDLIDLKSRLSGAVALDDVKPLMTEALQAIEGLERELEEARNDEREGIACYLVATGRHDIAGEVFVAMTRSINAVRREAAHNAFHQRTEIR